MKLAPLSGMDHHNYEVVRVPFAQEQQMLVHPTIKFFMLKSENVLLLLFQI